MIQTITFNTFIDSFKNCGRGNSFTYDGFKALFDYLEQLENECDMSIELDPIAFDCEYVEYGDLEEIQGDYPDVESIQDLYNKTQVIEFKTGIIISAY